MLRRRKGTTAEPENCESDFSDSRSSCAVHVASGGYNAPEGAGFFNVAGTRFLFSKMQIFSNTFYGHSLIYYRREHIPETIFPRRVS